MCKMQKGKTEEIIYTILIDALQSVHGSRFLLLNEFQNGTYVLRYVSFITLYHLTFY